MSGRLTEFAPAAPAQLHIAVDGVIVGKAAWNDTDGVWRAKLYRHALASVGLAAPPTWTAIPIESPTPGGIRRAVREAIERAATRNG